MDRPRPARRGVWLRIDKSEYVISESRDRSHTADGNYWWPAPDFRWTPGHAATISLTPTGDPAAALPERRQAPPIAYFYQYSATHGGGPTFKFRIHFSEQVDLSWKTLRSNSLTVTNGRVASARRLPGDSKRNWELTVAPTSREDITIVLPAGTDCAQQGTVCTPDGTKLHNRVKLTVPGPGRTDDPLTATFVDPPERHEGTGTFQLQILFSEPLDISYAMLRDHSFEVVGGTISRARRVDNRNDLWKITVNPSSTADVVVTIIGDRACDVDGAVCTLTNKKLSSNTTLTVRGHAA